MLQIIQIGSDVPKLNLEARTGTLYSAMVTKPELGESLGFNHFLVNGSRRYGTGFSTLDYHEGSICWTNFNPFCDVYGWDEFSTDFESLKSQFGSDIGEYSVICETGDISRAIALVNGPRRQGLGTIAHIQTLEELRKHYGFGIDQERVHHLNALNGRIKHLRAMGLRLGRYEFAMKYLGFPFPEKFKHYYQKSVAYAVNRGLMRPSEAISFK